jgi:hypothetical protein
LDSGFLFGFVVQVEFELLAVGILVFLLLLLQQISVGFVVEFVVERVVFLLLFPLKLTVDQFALLGLEVLAPK